MAARNMLRLAAVEQKTGHKKSQLYHLMAKGEFPRPVKISTQAVAWYEDEIKAWQEARPRVERGLSPSQRKLQRQAPEVA